MGASEESTAGKFFLKMTLHYSITRKYFFSDNVIDEQFSSIQLLSHVRLFATPWTAALQASLSITNSRSLLRLLSIESVMPSNHLSLGREDTWRRAWQSTPAFLPGESHGQRTQVGDSPWGRKESDATEGLSTRTQDGYFPPQPSPGFLQS